MSENTPRTMKIIPAKIRYQPQRFPTFHHAIESCWLTQSGNLRSSRETLFRPNPDCFQIQEIITGGLRDTGGVITSERVTLFRAFDLHRTGKGGGVAHEDITVHEIPLAEVVMWLEAKAKTGVLIDPKVYSGLFFIAQIK